jgi:hypothetical protein
MRSLKLLTVLTTTLGLAAAAALPVAAADTGPTVYVPNGFVRFIVGTQLATTEAYTNIDAFYGWTVNDPDGVCSQRLASEEYTSDYPQFFGDVGPHARRARFDVATGNYQDGPWAYSYVEYNAVDCGGNAFSGYGEFSVRHLQEDRLTYRGTWARVRSSAWSTGAGRVTRTAGSAATFTFNRSFGLIMPQGPGRGSFDVLIDGRFRGTVDLAKPTSVRRVVAAYEVSGGGSHTATLRSRTNLPVTIDAVLTS